MKRTSLFAFGLVLVLAFPLLVLSQEKLDFNTLLKLRPKKLTTLELGTQSPNELEGFEFVRKGKLKDIRLGISTKADVGRIFGNCTDACRYDSKWNVVFDYFSEISRTTTGLDEGKGHPTESQRYVPLPEYNDKLWSVRLAPRKKILFDKVIFSDEFYQSVGMIVGHSFDGSSGTTEFKTYTDGYGLTYSIIEEDSCTRCKKKKLRQKGELLSIEYTIPRDLEKKMFIEQK